jgi:phage host-nuclease inhibitor protein Gam
MKLSELVAKYIELRDKKAQIKAEYDGKVAKLDENLDKIEAVLLKTFDSAGMDSVKTEFGTAYTSTRTTASVANPDIFMKYVIANEAWHLLEKRAAKSGVEQYKAEHDDVPPGVSWRSERTVNIRRS